MDPTAAQTCSRFQVSFSPADGSIQSLVDVTVGFDWVANGTQGLGAYLYRTYDEADFDAFNLEYNPGCGPPCGDFAKPGVSTASPESKTWAPTLQAFYKLRSSAGASCTFLAALALDAEAVTKYGGMSNIWIKFDVDPEPSSVPPTLGVELSWLNKTATRLPESAWLSFVPALAVDPSKADLTKWSMNILGRQVSPLEVVPMGTRHVHAIDSGVHFDDMDNGGARVSINSLDAPLVSPGDAEHLIHYDGYAQPDLAGGWHFDIASQVWGSAFAQWYGDGGKARFLLDLQPPATGSRS